MVGYLQPLAHNFAIVTELGYPTEYFIRWAQQKQIDIEGSITEETAKEIVAQFLDDISTTQGSIMFRGEDQWEALPPGPPGQVLSTNGPDADPLWIPQSGGGEVSVELNGIEVVPSASVLNFTGGVSVTDGGSGKATINITGGGGGGVPTIVQSKSVATSNTGAGLTLDTPPQNGNILVAIIFNSTATTAPVTSAGWTALDQNTVLPDSTLCWRKAGPTETATQVPVSSSDGGILVIYEVAGGKEVVYTVGTTATSTTANVTFTTSIFFKTSAGLLITFSGRRSEETGVFTGSSPQDISQVGDISTVGGTGVSVSTGIGTLAVADSPSSSCIWPTSLATRAGWVLVA